MTSLNFPFYLISSRSYKKSFPYKEYLWDAYHLHQLFYISVHILWMPFIWRSQNASQTSLICLKENETGHWVSENILCVFMVALSTTWSGFITSSESVWAMESWGSRRTGNPKECWVWGFLTRLLLLCSPAYSSINPQTTWISSYTSLYSSDSESKASSAALMAVPWATHRSHFCVCAWLSCVQT